MLCSRCVGYEYTFCEVFWVGTDIAMGWMGFGSGFYRKLVTFWYSCLSRVWRDGIRCMKGDI